MPPPDGPLPPTLMFHLPPEARLVLDESVLPKQLYQLPDDICIQVAVLTTSELKNVIPEYAEPETWRKFRDFVGKKTQGYPVDQLYIKLYEDASYAGKICTQFSWMKTTRRLLERQARRNSELAYLVKPISELADEEQASLKRWFKSANPDEKSLKQLFNLADMDAGSEASVPIDDQPDLSKLTPKQRLRSEEDTAIFLCVALFCIHNAVAIYAFGEPMTALFHKAIAGGDQADEAMCMAVRIDRTLRKHPVFQARYELANDRSEEGFLNRYNNNAPPLPSDSKQPSAHLLVSILDGYGLLSRLTDSQLLDLYGLSHLDVEKGLITDVGGMAKVRRLYLERKQRGKSTQHT